MTKNPLQSKTIIAAIVGLVSYYLLNFTDIKVNEEELAELGEHIFVLGSFLAAAYGRWVADGKIKWFKDDSIKVDVSNLTEAEKNAVKSILSGAKK